MSHPPDPSPPSFSRPPVPIVSAPSNNLHSHRSSYINNPNANNNNDDEDDELPPVPALPFVSLPTFLSNPEEEANEDQARQFALTAVSVEKSERYRSITCPRIRDEEGKQVEYPIWSTPLREFKRFGLGILLYFHLLQALSVVYFIMFLTSLPSMIFNLKGHALTSDTFGLSQTALGNQGTVQYFYTNTSLSSANNGTIITSSIPVLDSVNDIMGLDRKLIGLIVTLCDLFYILIFIVFIIYITLRHRREGRKYHDDVLTVSRYAAAIYDIPPHCHDRLYLRNFFSRYGQVVDVCIAYNNHDLILLYKRRGEMKKRLIGVEVNGKGKNQQHLIENIQRNIHKIDQHIANIQSNLKLESRVAYIVYHRQEEVQKLLKAYPDEFLFHYFMPKSKRLYNEFKIRVRSAPEPSNILYENLQYSKKQKNIRRFATFLATLFLMSISTGIVWVSAYYQDKIPQPYQCDINGYPTSYSSSLTTEELYCYCSTLSTTQLLASNGHCDSYISAKALRDSLIFVTSIAVVVVNGMIAFFTSHISKMEAHSSRTSQQVAMAKKLSIGLFINMGIIVLLVNANLTPLVGFQLDLQFFFAGQFDDVSSTWFEVVGLSIMITLIINIFDPHIWYWLYSLLLRFRRTSCLDHRMIRDGKISQEKLNKKFQGNNFMLAKRYAIILSNLFVIFMYSSGMPILLLIGSLSTFVNYWIDKYLFYRHYRMPPRYDESIDEMATSMMPTAIILHCIMAIWFYSSPCTESYLVSSEFLTPIVSSTQLATFSIQNRILQWNCFPFFLILCIMLIYYLGKSLIDICCCSRHHISTISPMSGHGNFNAQRRLSNVNMSDTRPSYFEAANRIRFESYRVNEQPQFKSAYIVTKSLLQLAPDKEFSDVRFWFQQINRHELLPNQDHVEIGAGFISKEVEINEGMMISKKSSKSNANEKTKEKGRRGISWGTISLNKGNNNIHSTLTSDLESQKLNNNFMPNGHGDARHHIRRSAGGSVEMDMVLKMEEIDEEKEGGEGVNLHGPSPLAHLPPVHMAQPNDSQGVFSRIISHHSSHSSHSAASHSSPPTAYNAPPMLNRWASKHQLGVVEEKENDMELENSSLPSAPAESQSVHHSQQSHTRQLLSYGIHANKYGEGTLIPFTCGKCQTAFMIKDHGVMAKYQCPMPQCQYEFIV